MSLLVPQRWKYRKLHVKPISGTASRGTTVAFGEVGMKSLDNGYITNRELEAMRKVLIRSIKKI
jgi:large subunit ribosomal protein L16